LDVVERDEPLLLLVHGAWHGAWAFDPLLPLLAEAGVEARAVQLPGVGRGPGRHDLAGHTAALRAEIVASDRRLVVCGHSYGGAVVTQAAVGASNVDRLVYLAAFMLAEGESCADANAPIPPAPNGCTPVVEGDYLTVSADAAQYLFYNGCPADLAARAAGRLTPEHLNTVRSDVDRAAWRDIPSSYLVCERDNALAPEAQRRMAKRADECQVLDSGHSPMLGARAELATLLVDCVRRTRPRMVGS